MQFDSYKKLFEFHSKDHRFWDGFKQYAFCDGIDAYETCFGDTADDVFREFTVETVFQNANNDDKRTKRKTRILTTGYAVFNNVENGS